MSIKAKDIAEMLGVSTATVSIVLNNKPGVGPERRAEIINKVKELGCEYLLKEEPGELKNLGFVIYKRKGQIVDESPFFPYILEGINAKVKKNGYNLTFIYMNKDMSQEEQEQQIREADCEGLIIFAVEMIYEDLKVFKASGLPFVILDNSFRVNEVDAVAINNTQGIYKALTYLYECGHREIGYIRSKVYINSFGERYQAYQNILRQYDLPFYEEYTVEVGYSEAEARRDMREYLTAAPRRPTAFLADNDLLACGAVMAVRDAGYKVPEDISIIGFDDRPICSVVEPALTTVAIPKDIFGPFGVDLLLDKIRNGRQQSMKVEVGISLIVRDSVSRR